MTIYSVEVCEHNFLAGCRGGQKGFREESAFFVLSFVCWRKRKKRKSKEMEEEKNIRKIVLLGGCEERRSFC